jgi:hypothetical protein
MSKPKRKLASPQLLKQQEAENKKRFYRKVKELFTTFGQPELFTLLSIESLEKMHLSRISPPIVEFGPSINIKGSKIRKVKEVLYENLKLFPVDIKRKDLNLNLYDYLTVGLTIKSIFIGSSLKEIPEARLIQKKLNPLFFDLFSDKNIADIISIIDISLSSGLNKLNGNLYSLTADWRIVNQDHLATFFRFHEIKNQRIEILIDGLIRPVFRVAWARYGQYAPVYVERKRLGLDPKHYPEKIDVYVQNHALHRLCERMDKIPESELHMHIFNSFGEGNKITRHFNSYYFELKLYNKYKVGYLVASLVDNKLIMKTFLLLTQEGTPEEQKLRQLTGLSRYDIQFLNLDKFSSFFDSTLYTDTKMKALFEEAGFKPILDCVSNNDWATDNKSKLADRLRKYLLTKEDEPNWEEIAETIEPDTEADTKPFEVVPCDERKN